MVFLMYKLKIVNPFNILSHTTRIWVVMCFVRLTFENFFNDWKNKILNYKRQRASRLYLANWLGSRGRSWSSSEKPWLVEFNHIFSYWLINQNVHQWPFSQSVRLQISVYFKRGFSSKYVIMTLSRETKKATHHNNPTQWIQHF